MENTRNTLTPLLTDAILTPAETRIASGYTAGLIGKEIADRCGISYNTVVKHTQNIYDKAGIKRSTVIAGIERTVFCRIIILAPNNRERKRAHDKQCSNLLVHSAQL